MKQIRLSEKDLEAMKEALKIAISEYTGAAPEADLKRWEFILNRLNRLKVK